MTLESRFKALTKGRPHGRYWVEGDYTTGMNGSTEYFHLCAAMDEQDEDGRLLRVPAPARFGRILCSIILGTYGYGNLDLSEDKKLDLSLTVYCTDSFDNHIKDLEILNSKLHKRVCQYLDNAQNKEIKDYNY